MSNIIATVGHSNQEHAEFIAGWFGQDRLLGAGVCQDTGRLVLEFESGFLTIQGNFEFDIRTPGAGRRVAPIELKKN